MSQDQLYEYRLGHYAGFITRLFAWIIDQLIIAALFWLTHYIGDFVIQRFASSNPTYENIMQLSINLLNVILYFAYFIGGWTLSGQTVGKSLLGLRVVCTDGKRVKFRNAIVRLIGYWISSLIFFMGYWWVLFDKRRQAWHDHISKTCVVYSESWEERSIQNAQIRDHLEQRRQQRLSKSSNQ